MAELRTEKGRKRIERKYRPMRQAHLRKLRIETKALSLMEKRLDSALENDARDENGRPLLSNKDLTNLANYSSRQTAQRDLLLATLGLSPKALPQGGTVVNQTFNILNSNYEARTPEEKALLQKLRLEQLRTGGALPEPPKEAPDGS